MTQKAIQAPQAPPRGKIHDQAVDLPRPQVMIVFVTLGVVFFIVTLDTTCVSTALPKIAADLNAGSSITWVGTSLLVASTTTQVIVSRLSDIFGRKVCLQVSLAIFALGNLLCGFAQSPGWLYAARGVAGIGAGGVSSLCLIVITDVVSLRERGKYISMMGIPTALGLGLGPEIGGVLADRVSWRWVFWIIVPVAVVALPIIQFFLPLKPVPGNIREKLKMVDWWGSLAAFAAIILLLVPISAGGSSFAWSSTESVVMLVFGSVLMLVFLVIEYYHPLPIMPLHLFRNRTVALVLATMFLVGIVWNGNFYMAPLYFQNVLGYNPVAAGALMVPLLVGQIIVMTAAGYALQKWGRARTIILLGYLVWTAGQGMQIAWGVHKNLALIIAAMAVQGIGFGSTSQTTLVLAQASCDSADRAVVTGLRHVFRNFGGAAGLAISNALMNAEFFKRMPASLPNDMRANLRNDGFSREYILSAPISQAQQDATVHAYYVGIWDSFVMYTPVLFTCFVFCLGCADTKLDDPSPPPATEENEMTDLSTTAPAEASDGSAQEQVESGPELTDSEQEASDSTREKPTKTATAPRAIIEDTPQLGRQRAMSSSVLSRKSSRRRTVPVPDEDE